MMNYTKAKELVASVDGFSEIKFPEQNISIFSYRYSKYENFISDTWAKWMRGITFVFNDDDDYEMYPMFPKFFNVDENEGNRLSDLKKMKIKSVTEKRDGSLVMPIILNDKVVFKTMKSIKNNITNKCVRFYSGHHKDFIDTYIGNYSILFEYTSPENKIVLEYDKEELTVIGMVNRKTMEIVDYETLSQISAQYNVPLVKSVPIDNIDDLIKMSKIKENIEGWVITFTSENGDKMVKLKTKWYTGIHSGFSLINSRKVPMNMLVRHILNHTIDDIIPLIQQETRKKYVIKIKNMLDTHFEQLVDDITGYYKDYCKYTNKKEYMSFIRSNCDNDDPRKRYVGILLTSIGNGKNMQNISVNIKKNTKSYLLKLMNTSDKANKYLNSFITL